MGIGSANPLLLASAASGGDSDPVTRSLRLDSASSSDLSRDPASAGDSQTFTFACWVKRTKLGATQRIFSSAHSTADDRLAFKSDDTLEWNCQNNNISLHVNDYTKAKFRDVSAFYHICLSVDTTQATASNRIKLYVNGVLQEMNGSNQPAQNTTFGLMGTGYVHTIGSYTSSNEYLDGYLADVYFLDGTQVAPIDNFIESNNYGGYKPKAYTGSFGTNGFHIDAQPAHDADLLVSSVGRNDGDTDFVDVAAGHTISTEGDPEHSDTVGNPFDSSGTAMYFDGGDTLTGPSDLAFGTGAFTIEFWYQHVSDINGGVTGANADIVISKGRRHTSYQGWLLFTHNNGTDKVNWVGYKVNGSSGTNYSLDANSTGVSLAHDGDWHHIAVTRDGSGNMGLFIDGTRYADATGYGGVIDNSNYAVRLASAYNYTSAATGHYANCYLYDVRITKGEAKYDPTSSSVTKPSAPFELNPVYIGGDQSGNKNHFTPTNISMHDILLDTPTKNYCLINPQAETKTDSSSYDANPTTGLSEGNLKLTSSGNFFNGHGTLGVSSGKWYFEWYSTGDWTQGGFSTHEMFSNYSQSVTDFWILYNRDSSNNIAAYYKDGTSSSSETWAGGGHASGNGNVFGCAFDVTNRKMYFHKNGEWSDGTSTLTSTFPSSYGGDLTGSSHNIPADTTFYPTVRPWVGSTVIANFGQDSTFANTVVSGSANAADTNGNGDFRYTPPSGYLALCTANLDAPTVTPSEHFNTVLYNGSYDGYNGVGTDSQSITGVGFSPDICWIKDRDNQAGNSNSYYGHYWFDTVLGTGSAINIDAEQGLSGSLNSSEDGISSFDSDGFTVDEAEETNFAYDSSGSYGDPDTFERYVAWCWKLGTTASSWSGSGQDPDSEQYNSDAGMSIINYYDGDYAGSSITFNHSLGAAPEFAIALDYEGYHSANYAWHKDLSSGNYLELSDSGSQTSDSTYFPSSPATNTTFEMGVSLVDGIQSHVALFRSVEGYSKFGSYTGNGSSDGPFIYTGFRPSFVLIKNIGASQDWFLLDNKREGYNVVDDFLEPNTSNAEATASTNKADFTANGFKLRGSGSVTNQNNTSFVYACFSESPFKHANAK